MKNDNTSLAAVAYGAGVLTQSDFAIFQDHGYRGLYAGETAADIHARKGLKKGQRILDYMGSTELAANWFRITQAEDKIAREEIADKQKATDAHHDMGVAVRGVILEQGGAPPEQLPTPSESIARLRAREQKRLESERNPSLWDEDNAGEG